MHGSHQIPLFNAIESNDLTSVKLLTNNTTIAQSDEHGNTPLILSARLGYLDILQFLISKGANVDAKSRRGFTALSWSLKYDDHFSVVKILIRANATVTFFEVKELIHKATRDVDFELVKLLVQKNHDALNQLDKFGQTPFLVAVRYGHTTRIQSLVSGGHTGLIQYFVSKHVNLNVVTDNPGSSDHGKTALQWASERDYPAVTNLLVQEGALDIPWSNGEYLVHKAASKGDIGLVKRLIEKNIGLLDQTDSFGQTPLIIAASQGHTDIVRYLVLNRANLDLARRYTRRNEPVKTALQLAADSGYSPIIKMLIKAGAVITLHDAKSLLFKAAMESEFELLTLLVSKNPSLLNQTDEFGQSSLLLAVRYGSTSAAQSLVSGGHVAIVQYLIEKGAYINLAANGKTALHWASERNYPAVLRLLIQEGASDTPWGDGEYLVHKATRKGDIELVKCLIEKKYWFAGSIR